MASSIWSIAVFGGGTLVAGLLLVVGIYRERGKRLSVERTMAAHRAAMAQMVNQTNIETMRRLEAHEEWDREQQKEAEAAYKRDDRSSFERDW